MVPLAKLSMARIQSWHQKLAESPARLRTKLGEAQKYREAASSAEGIRRQGKFFPCRAALQGAGREGRGKRDIVDSVVCFWYVLIWVLGPSLSRPN